MTFFWKMLSSITSLCHFPFRCSWGGHNPQLCRALPRAESHTLGFSAPETPAQHNILDSISAKCHHPGESEQSVLNYW